MPVISSLYATFSSLHQRQDAALRALDQEIQEIGRVKAAQYALSRKAVEDMVLPGNTGRYDALTVVARQAGVRNDYAALVGRWTAEDAENRRRYDQLVSTHGSRNSVHAKATAAKSERDQIKRKLDAANSAVSGFDTVTQKIEDHNKRFPATRITRESHDAFEKFSFFAWVAYWTIGFFSEEKRGAHNAYLTLGEFTREHGDYYESMDTIELERNKAAGLQSDYDREHSAYTNQSDIVADMDSLSAAYKGPAKMAAEVAQMVYHDMTTGTDAFARELFESEIGRASQAVPAMLRARALERVKAGAHSCSQRADEIKTDLERQVKFLNAAAETVGRRTVDYSASSTERMVETQISGVSSVAVAVQFAKDSIVGWQPSASTTYDDMDRHLLSKTGNFPPVIQLNLNFSSMRQSVQGRVDEYQEEVREAERQAAAAAAAERQRLAAAAAAAAAATVVVTRQSPAATSDAENEFGSAGRVAEIFGGSAGIADEEPVAKPDDNIFGGGQGIQEEKDNIFGNNSGITDDPQP